MREMKLSCLPVSYFRDIIDGRMSIREWAVEGASTGLDGIDLSVLFLKSRSREYLDKTRREIEEAGIRIAMVTTYPDFTHPDPMERERQLAKLQEDIVTASRLGADLLRVTAGQAHPSKQAMPKLPLQTHPRTRQPPRVSSQEIISRETTDTNNTDPQMAKQLNTHAQRSFYMA